MGGLNMGMVRKTEFSRWMENKRDCAGWSQVELSKRCGFHGTYTNKLERGKITATYDAVEAVCKVFEVGPVERIQAFILAGYIPHEYAESMRKTKDIALKIYLNHTEAKNK
jgi:transcriptional regulator with XRE-family HTH domain